MYTSTNSQGRRGITLHQNHDRGGHFQDELQHVVREPEQVILEQVTQNK